jgi:hypothetical protein
MAILRNCFVGFAVAALASLATAQQTAPASSKHEPALDVTSMDRSVDTRLLQGTE